MGLSFKVTKQAFCPTLYPERLRWWSTERDVLVMSRGFDHLSTSVFCKVGCIFLPSSLPFENCCCSSPYFKGLESFLSFIIKIVFVISWNSSISHDSSNKVLFQILLAWVLSAFNIYQDSLHYNSEKYTVYEESFPTRMIGFPRKPWALFCFGT